MENLALGLPTTPVPRSVITSEALLFISRVPVALTELCRFYFTCPLE